MKKLIAIALSLVMLFCSAFALAESNDKVTLGTISINGEFTLQCGLPEGYTPVPLVVRQDLFIAKIQSEDPQAPVMMLSIAFDETYSDVDRMNDLSSDDLAILEQTYIVDDPEVEITYGETGLGTLLLIARHQTDTQDFISFLSVYKGYFVEFVLVPSETADDQKLTDEQLSMSIDFLTELDFIPGTVRPSDPSLALAGQTFMSRLTDYDAEAGTVLLTTMEPVMLDQADVEALQVGDTLTFGPNSVVIDALEQEEDSEDLIVNDSIILEYLGDNYYVYEMDRQVMIPFFTLTVAIPETLVFLDGIDPATGEMLDTLTEQTAADLKALLAQEGGIDFASDNVLVTFDHTGTISQVERIYRPW